VCDRWSQWFGTVAAVLKAAERLGEVCDRWSQWFGTVAAVLREEDDEEE
jgi:hypothetical protein